MIEELVESLEHTHAIKDVMHDIEPPEPFTVFESCRFSYRKNWRWGFAKGSAERVFDRD
jgi:hypothetical protein